MSETLAVSVPNPAPSVGGSWIKANALAALINTAMGLIALLLAHAFGANKPDAGSFAKLIVFLTYVFAGGVGVAIFATLNGRVLREKIPAFPLGTWVGFHLVAGLLAGLFAGWGALQPPPDMSQMNQALSMPGAWIGFLAGGLFGGAVVGLVAGSFQAFIMRHAVQHLGSWIGFWVLAGMVSVLAYGLVFFMINPLAGMTNEIITQGLGFVSAIIMSIVMLPAVARLAPRQHQA